MRLKCIKLAGFKSFVDPTTVHFPGNMCSVVGPNGCGKSNIIDAVRWVMGESSARHLRGQSMTDVIFKGSQSRKPAAHAQVELVFDNTRGRVVGSYAAFNEISVKRHLTSDAVSSYFLNGGKCRRKDVMDLFLGTGLGPRSYSIISQGIVSSLIESKPEELRVFIEEAAGISRYKERRRETENRIQRTTGNLDRLADLREELDRQLVHLKRQADAAARYREYKSRERQKKAELQALRWRAVDKESREQESAMRDAEVQMEAAVARQRSDDATIERLRQEHIEENDIFQSVQGAFYSVGNDIARIEQTIAHRKERGEQLRQDLEEAERSGKDNQEHIAVDREQLEETQGALDELEPALEEARAREEEHLQAVSLAEEAQARWQQAWDSFQQESSAPRQSAEVEQSRIQHLELALERMGERLARQNEELASLDAGAGDDEEAVLRDELAELDYSLEETAEKTESLHDSLHLLRQQMNEKQSELSESGRQLNELRGRKAALETLQQAALDCGEKAWLESRGLADKARLAERLEVEPGWETAVETVLGDSLQALCLDEVTGLGSLEAMGAALAEDAVGLSFVAPSDNIRPGSDGSACLSQHVRGAPAWLSEVRAVDSLEQAQALRAQLGAGQSVVTRDGIWLGPDWLRVTRRAADGESVLERRLQLEQLEEELEQLGHREERLATELADGRRRAESLEAEAVACQRQRESLLSRHGDIKADLGARQSRHEQNALRLERLQEEIRDTRHQSAAEKEKLAQSRLRLEEALDRMADDGERKAVLQREREEVQRQLEQARQQGNQDREDCHQLALRQQTLVSRRDALKASLARLGDQVERDRERLEQLHQALAESDGPADHLHEEHEQLLEKRLQAEQRMIQSRQQLEAVDAALRKHEKQRSQAEKEAGVSRERLEKLRMDWQARQVRKKTLEEQLQEQEQDLEALCAQLPEDAAESQWEEHLTRLENSIQRLGAINLAAIDEYEQQSERKRYLDAQDGDLREALATLESAIARIDRETRSRFRATFDKVNEGLGQLFPRVFGGGNASLALTEEDLLSTGVTIMAQPPGKKNSTIHLLSGGEKALTAIALVFAIFQLNPSPFCLLDEVDAPLDDSNVTRYTNMVKEMSERVQFIYISHNKIAMEEADQLIGVTMHEPGVSRPVSVDIEQAAAMAVS